MKTNVLMQREFLSGTVSQRIDDEFMSATDLFREGNLWRIENRLDPLDMKTYMKRKTTHEFIMELQNDLGIKVYRPGRGRSSHTWVHPILFMDMALSLNPKLKVRVYKWLYDHLIKNRHNSGDSYKLMTGALWKHTNSQTKFRFEMISVSKKIQNAVGVVDWQLANEFQLKMRDDIHKTIAIFSAVVSDNKKAVELGIEHVLKVNE